MKREFGSIESGWYELAAVSALEERALSPVGRKINRVCYIFERMRNLPPPSC